MYGWCWRVGAQVLGWNLLCWWKVLGPWVWQELQLGWKLWWKYLIYWMAHFSVCSKCYGQCCCYWLYACWDYTGIHNIWNITFWTYWCFSLILSCQWSFILLMNNLLLSRSKSGSWPCYLEFKTVSLNFLYWVSLCLSIASKVLFMFLIHSYSNCFSTLWMIS